jgi:alginate O-acetyltransferase complex protein AlgJ
MNNDILVRTRPTAAAQVSAATRASAVWRRRAATGQALATIALLGWGAWQGLAAIAEPSARARIAMTLSLDSLLDGRTAAAVNHVMAHGLPADLWLRAAGGVLRWELFGSGGPQVRIGCDDWLFLTEELRPWPGAAAAMAERADALARIRARLEQRGVALQIAVVPDKARVHAEMLCGVPRAAEARDRLDAWMGLLHQRGLAALSLLDTMTALKPGGPAYWRTDTHWNQRGAAAAAEAIARATAHLDLSRAERFHTEAAAEESDGPGDLLRLTSLDRVPDWLRPAPDRQRLERTVPVEEGQGLGLLDEAPATEVVLLGSSYSVNANFHGRLQQAMSSTVPNYAKAGGGFAGAAQEYFASASWRDSPPRLVIWEIPERMVGQPLGEEERAFLARW